MNEVKYKKEYKPSSCTSPPWAHLIAAHERLEVLRKIRQECIDIYGYAFDECPKRMTCFKKECIGRPLPWKSPTALPYLEQLKNTQIIKGDELFITTDCSFCPIADICKSPCNQILDFIGRNKSLEPTIDYTDNLEAAKVVSTPLEPANILVGGADIPWDVLTKRKAAVIKRYLYESRDFRSVGEFVGFGESNQARAKYEFYSAITKLSEYANVRQFLKNHTDTLTDRQKEIFELVYAKNKSFVQTARLLKVSKQSIQQTVARVLKKNNIKWKVYVRKIGNRIVYNVPEIFKG